MKRLAAFLILSVFAGALLVGCGSSDGTDELKSGAAAPQGSTDRDED